MAKVSGSLWVEGNNLHYVDQFNREWYMPGRFWKAAPGALPGSIWVDSATKTLFFTPEAGGNVYFASAVLTANLALTVLQGSLWIGQDNLIHWVAPNTGSVNVNVIAHIDTAATSGHTDAHQDGGHGDAHTDNPHSDVHSDTVHDDGHTDIQHGDIPAGSSHDDGHLDSPSAVFNDHYDAYRTQHYDASTYWFHMDTYWVTSGTHEDNGHYDGSKVPNHGDQNNHTDVPHNDYHGDAHGDTPHSDIEGKNQHGDFYDSVAHSDIPHSDIPHVDTPHQDAHQDTHTDTPHQDEPVLIGP